MGILTKQDLKALFVILAIVFFLDSVNGGFLLPLGIVIAVIIVAVVWLSDNPQLARVGKSIGERNVGSIIRIAIAVTLIGVFFQNALIIAVGLLIGIAIVLMPSDTFRFDLSKLSVEAASTQKQQKAKSSRKYLMA